MSKGDINTFSIPTLYNGIQMRSRLETKIAMFLDSLKIKWDYEPRTFYLSSGIYYKPDFFLKEYNQWIEVKGVIGKNNIDLSTCFVSDTKNELILWSDLDIIFFELWNNDICSKNNNGIIIGSCSNCNSNFLCGDIGSYHCRKCGNHNGDHDLKYYFNCKNIIGGEDINFSNKNEIKLWIEKNATKI